MRDERLGGLCPAGVDEFGYQAWESGQVLGPDRPRELLDRSLVGGAVDQADDPLLCEAALGAPNTQVGG